MNVPRPNGNGRAQAHAAGLGGAISIIVIAILAQGFGIKLAAPGYSAITVLCCYAAAWLPKPPSGK